MTPPESFPGRPRGRRARQDGGVPEWQGYDAAPIRSPKGSRLIYVCIPVHDEARTVGVLLWKIRNVMRELARDYELLVLDDASADDTAATAALVKNPVYQGTRAPRRMYVTIVSAGTVLRVLLTPSTLPRSSTSSTRY